MNNIEILQNKIKAKKESVNSYKRDIETKQGIVRAVLLDIKQLEEEVEKEKQKQSENAEIELSALQLVFIINGSPFHLVYIERNWQIRSILSGHGWFTELKDDPTIQEIVDFMANFPGFTGFFKINDISVFYTIYTGNAVFNTTSVRPPGELKQYLIDNTLSQIS